MANEKLTIQKKQARLTVIGNSYPDENTDSGSGIDLTQELIEILEDLDIDLPPIDFDDWDDIPVIIGFDDTGHPLIVYPDPDTDEIIEWPIAFPIDEIDWEDTDITPGVIGNQPVIIIETDGVDPIIWPIELPDDIDIDDWEDFDIQPIVGPDGEIDIVFEDPDTGIDYDIDVGDLDIGGLIDIYDLDWNFDITVPGLYSDGLDSFAMTDLDLTVKISNEPSSIVIVTPPKKLTYLAGESVDLTGMVVTAKKADGTTWTSAKYPNGHIPLGELYIHPRCSTEDIDPGSGESVDLSEVNSMWYCYVTGQGGANPTYWPNIVLWNSHGPLNVYFSGLDNQTPSPVTLTWDANHKVWWSNIDINGYSPSPIYGPVTTDARTLLPYLDGTGESGKCITVTWLRPGDGAALSTYFSIKVERRGGNGGR